MPMTRREDARRTLGRALAAWLLAAAGTAAWAASAQHTVSEHECLWDLSKHYYQDPYRWRAIHGANPQVQDPNLIYPGQVLTIPEAGAEKGAKVELEAPAPVETGAALEAAPIAVPEPQSPIPVSAAAPEPAETMPRAEPAAPRPEKGIVEDSLSIEFPEGQAGQYPSLTRFQAPKGWKEDGRVTEFNEEEVIAGPGDLAEARLAGKTTAQVGERFFVVRADVATEEDEDQKATYLQRVGVVRVEALLPKGRVRVRVLKAGGAVETGDFLSRQGL